VSESEREVTRGVNEGESNIECACERDYVYCVYKTAHTCTIGYPLLYDHSVCVCVKKIDRVSERGCVTERGADGGGGIVFFRI